MDGQSLLLTRIYCNISELSIEDNCILWNARVIPDVLLTFVLKELHNTYPGITRMRMLVRSYV